MTRSVVVVAVAALALLAGCVSEIPPLEPEPSDTPSATPESSPSEPVGPPISMSEPNADGVVTITVDPAALEPLYYAFNQNGSDPLWQLHTDQSDLFISVELYTVYGQGWTGQLGTFAVDCTANGICVYLDVDGEGGTGVLGPAATGQITIDQLDESGYDVTLMGVAFPMYALADLTLRQTD